MGNFDPYYPKAYDFFYYGIVWVGRWVGEGVGVGVGWGESWIHPFPPLF